VALIAEDEKVVEGSLSVNVSVAVSPIPSRVLLDVITTEGATVSVTIGGASDPAALGLFAASKNFFAATEMVPGTVEPVSGVKTAE
jgi:hypothetical protein